jgi:hypothetical protein
METKDGNHGLDIWHMECSDHAAAREDDDVSADLRKMGINEWKDRARDREAWRRIVMEAKIHPGL